MSDLRAPLQVPLKMKDKCFRLALFTAAAFSTVPSFAATATKTLIGTELTGVLSSVWIGGSGLLGSPTTSDTVAWNNMSAFSALTAASNVTWGSMIFNNGSSMAGDADISGSGIITLGKTSSGDVITVNAGKGVTINNEIKLTWGGAAISPGSTTRQLAFNTAGPSLTLGKITANGDGTVNDANVKLGGSGIITVNGAVTIDGQLYKGDGGTAVLNSANTIGWVYMDGGTLLAGSNAAYGSGTIHLASGGFTPTLGSMDSTARSFTNSLNLGTNLTFGQMSGGTGNLSFSGNVALGTAIRTITTNANTTLSGVVSGASGGIIKSGNGFLTLTNANTYSGGTTVNAGMLSIGHARALGSGPVTVNGGTLDLGIEALENTISLNGGTLTGTHHHGKVNVGGNAVMNGDFNEVEVGTNGSVSLDTTGGLQVASLKGQGSFSGGPVSVVAYHNPGNSSGSSLGTQTFDAGLTYGYLAEVNLEIDSLGLNWDRIEVGDALTFDFNVLVNVSLSGAANYGSAFWNSNHSFKLFTFDTLSADDGFEWNLDGLDGDPAEGFWNLTQDSGSISAVWTAVPELAAVPEPGVVLFGCLGLIGLLRRRRH